MLDATSLTDRLFLAGIRKGVLEPLAVRALNNAVHLLSLALATRIQSLRASDDPLLKAAGERWGKVPAKRRLHFTPGQRFRILRIKRLLALSPEDAAHLFRVAPGTISAWLTELSGHPERTDIGKTVRPTPPLQKYTDVVQHTVQAIAVMGFSGYETIAQTLARVGWRLSRSTVARHLKKPKPTTETHDPRPAERRVQAKYVNHIWMMDFTVVMGLFGLQQFTIATILDVHSRFPVAVQVLQRFGAVGKHGSIGIIDRFFRTIKDALGLRTWRSLQREDLERRLDTALTHYSLHRPHQSLAGATPGEIYFGFEPTCRSAVPPRRARDGDSANVVPFRIAHLDAGQRFPIIEKIAA
jgi:hypothetical protein